MNVSCVQTYVTLWDAVQYIRLTTCWGYVVCTVWSPVMLAVSLFVQRGRHPLSCLGLVSCKYHTSLCTLGSWNGSTSRDCATGLYNICTIRTNSRSHVGALLFHSPLSRHSLVAMPVRVNPVLQE